MQRIATLSICILIGLLAQAQQGYKKVHNQLLDQAKVHLANEEYEEAVKVYRRLLPVDPLFVEVQHEMGV